MIILDGKNLNLESLYKIAYLSEKVEIDKAVIPLINQASDYVNNIVKNNKAVYGINTGFGKLATVSILDKDVSTLQRNLLISHACGVGEPLSVFEARAMLALRINALIKGNSGIRLETINKMVELLNNNITPVIYEKGSLGASGDLALLSHMSLPLIGLGEVIINNKIYETKAGFALKNVKPLENLNAKEGLSLINGTQAMTAIGALNLYHGYKILKYANFSYALTMEALLGITSALDEKVHEIRNQKGQIVVAKEMREFLTDSNLTTFKNDERIQDAYSLRCAPQVHGAVLNTLEHVKDILEREFNAVTDNPLIFPNEDEAISAGNFHGEPIAFVLDYLAIAISELANISERRIERMVNPQLSNNLPAFLVSEAGLNSGFMIVQYTAAALVSENKIFAHPASVDSIPSSANQEDHVSMGTIAARKLRTIIDHTYKVLSYEMFTAAQAIDFRDKTKLGSKTKKAYELIRKEIPFIEKDELMHPYMVKIEKLLKEDAFKNIIG